MNARLVLILAFYCLCGIGAGCDAREDTSQTLEGEPSYTSSYTISDVSKEHAAAIGLYKLYPSDFSKFYDVVLKPARLFWIEDGQWRAIEIPSPSPLSVYYRNHGTRAVVPCTSGVLIVDLIQKKSDWLWRNGALRSVNSMDRNRSHIAVVEYDELEEGLRIQLIRIHDRRAWTVLIDYSPTSLYIADDTLLTLADQQIRTYIWNDVPGNTKLALDSTVSNTAVNADEIVGTIDGAAVLLSRDELSLVLPNHSIEFNNEVMATYVDDDHIVAALQNGEVIHIDAHSHKQTVLFTANSEIAMAGVTDAGVWIVTDDNTVQFVDDEGHASSMTLPPYPHFKIE